MTRKLNWGILGAASIARSAVAPAIKASNNGVLAAVASRNADSAQRFADELGVAKTVESYEALLADPTIDVIYNPLPNALHAEWSKRAAEAGKAVLCEKPLTMEAGTAERLIAECAAAKQPLMEAFMYRFHPQHRRVLEIIESGEIGDVVEVRSHLSVDLMSPPDPSNVRFKSELGGGALLDMGCYGISICRMIFGETPRSVRGWWHLDETFGVDVTAAGILEFSGGRVGLPSCSFVGSGQGFYTVIGRSGTIEVPRGIIPGQGDRFPQALIIVTDHRGARRSEELPDIDQYQLMVEAFGDAVINGNPVPLSNDDTIANMKVLDAFARSAKSGSVETV
jgi:predicted dehydrogenase